jgi:hypothetical protein
MQQSKEINPQLFTLIILHLYLYVSCPTCCDPSLLQVR